MRKMAADALLPGMKLARPVVGQNGMVLLAAGMELNEKWIGRIRDMELDGVLVDGPGERAVPLDEALACLERRFETVRDQPHTALLMQAVRKHMESLYHP